MKNVGTLVVIFRSKLVLGHDIDIKVAILAGSPVGMTSEKDNHLGINGSEPFHQYFFHCLYFFHFATCGARAK